MAIGSWSDDFRNKYGFNDGATVEVRDFKARAILTRRLNRLPAFRDAGVRAVEYDRAGFHNPCMVLLIPRGMAFERWRRDTSWCESPEPEGVDFDEFVAQAYCDVGNPRRRRRTAPVVTRPPNPRQQTHLRSDDPEESDDAR